MRVLKSSMVIAGAVLALMAPRAFAGNIVETADSAGQFKTLLAAATAAGLVDTLSNGGPFTVFAPTDAAFAKLPKNTVPTLLKPKNKAKLVEILTYHVVPGVVTAEDVMALKQNTKVKTVNGKTITVRKANGVMVNNAKVIKADVMADNGVIHVIDTVLIPGKK